MDCRVKPGNDERVFSLRPYQSRDEDAAIALWLKAWQATYPLFDFSARLPWWRARWTSEIMAAAKIVIAQTSDPAMIGFVTVDPVSHYLDQLVVAPEFWGFGVGQALIADAKRHFAGGARARRQYRQCPRHRLLPKMRLRHHRRRRQCVLRPAGAPHELAGLRRRHRGNK